MSKHISIELHTHEPCTLSSVVELLRKASLDIRDKEGNIYILNKESYDYEAFSYSDKEFFNLPQDIWFTVYGEEIKEATVYLLSENCLCLYIDAYINRVLLSENQPVPDFNMYYDCLVNKMDSSNFVRVTFEEF